MSIKFNLRLYRQLFDSAHRGLELLAAGRRIHLHAVLAVATSIGCALYITAIILDGNIVEEAANG